MGRQHARIGAGEQCTARKVHFRAPGVQSAFRAGTRAFEQARFADGVTFDFEDPLPAGSPEGDHAALPYLHKDWAHLSHILLGRVHPHGRVRATQGCTPARAPSPVHGRAYSPRRSRAVCVSACVRTRVRGAGSWYASLISETRTAMHAVSPAHICIRTRLTPPTSAPGLGPPLPHLPRDWAHPAHICAATWPSPSTSAPAPGPPRPHLRRDWAHPAHICAGTR
jgi:hypothetical protein